MHQVSLDYQCPLVLLFLLIFSFLHNTRICPSIRPANKFCCMQLESGEKGWIKVTDWNSLQTGILLSMSNNQISLSLSSFIHQMKLTNPRKKQSAYSIVICPDPASDSTDAQRARFFAVSSASAASACPNAPMTVRSRKKKEKKCSRMTMFSVPVKPDAISSAVFLKKKTLPLFVAGCESKNTTETSSKKSN
jgi:hypothetical protein